MPKNEASQTLQVSNSVEFNRVDVSLHPKKDATQSPSPLNQMFSDTVRSILRDYVPVRQ